MLYEHSVGTEGSRLRFSVDESAANETRLSRLYPSTDAGDNLVEWPSRVDDRTQLGHIRSQFVPAGRDTGRPTARGLVASPFARGTMASGAQSVTRWTGTSRLQGAPEPLDVSAAPFASSGRRRFRHATEHSGRGYREDAVEAYSILSATEVGGVLTATGASRTACRSITARPPAR